MSNSKFSVHAVALVNNDEISEVTIEGDEHIIIPSHTMPDDIIMNDILYPAAEIKKSYKSLQNTLAPVNHPTLNGKYISANHPVSINNHHIGAWNHKVERRGNRVYIEKLINKRVAGQTELGQSVLDAVSKKSQIHTSTGLTADLKPNSNKKLGYSNSAYNIVFDHDAILPNGVIGAATPEQGVGLFVNVSSGIVITNGEVLEFSYFDRLRLLQDAVTSKFGRNCYLEDFSDTSVIISVYNNLTDRREYRAFGYNMTADAITFAEDGSRVLEKRSWSDKIPIVNALKQLLTRKSEQPDGELEMDKSELEAVLKTNNEQLSEAIAKALVEANRPIVEALDVLKTNSEATLKAETGRVEAEKRAVVAAKVGDVIANGLSGEALDEAFKLYQKPAANVHVNGQSDAGNNSDQYAPPPAVKR